MSTIRGLNLLEDGEQIRFFYSDAILDITDGMYFFTDRKVVVYGSGLENPAIITPYSMIAAIELAFDDSFFNDSLITLTLVDDTYVSFPVSSESGGDKPFTEHCCPLGSRMSVPTEQARIDQGRR